VASVSVRKVALLALLSAPDPRGIPAAPIVGSTRLQKLLFLLQKALPRVSGDRELQTDLSFEPYRFGPADLHVYQDLEFLEALGHVSRTLVGSPDEAPTTEESTERALSFGYLMGDEDEAELFAEVEGQTEVYSVTESGKELLGRIVTGASGRARTTCEQVLAAAADVKAQYGSWPLQRLLREVYSRYPEMTTASEIRGRVLGRG
jgi:hypothetical protein